MRKSYRIALLVPILVTLLSNSASVYGQANDSGSGGVDNKGQQIHDVEKPPTPEQALNRYTENLTEKANRPGRVYFGNSPEIRQALESMSRPDKKNILWVVADAGAGKTEFVTQLSLYLEQMGRTVYSLEPMVIGAGTHYRGTLEDRTVALVKALAESNHKKVLFVDEVHALQEKYPDIMNKLKPAMADGSISVIGATTHDEFKVIESDKALKSRGLVTKLASPTIQTIVGILRLLKPGYIQEVKQTHGLDILISDRALEKAAKMAFEHSSDESKIREANTYVATAVARWTLERLMGGMAELELKDRLQSAKVELQSLKGEEIFQTNDFELQERIEALEKEVKALETKIGESGNKEAIAKAQAELDEARDQVRSLQKAGNLAEAAKVQMTTVQKLETEIRTLEAGSGLTMDPRGITEGNMETFVRQLKKLNGPGRPDAEILKTYVSEVNRSLVGQEHLAEALAKQVKIREAGVTESKGPKVTMLIMGPTGVGKTEFVKITAGIFMGDPKAVNTLNMTNFTNSGDRWRLTGAASGHVNSEDGGRMTEPTRRNPRIINYIDEFGSEHREVSRAMMDPLEEGISEDGLGRKVDYRQSFWIGSSNLGSEIALMRLDPNFTVADLEKHMGFENGTLQGKSRVDIDDIVGRELLKRADYAPEVINRIDVISIANAMTLEMAMQVAKLRVESTRKLLLENKGIHMTYSETAVRALAITGYNAQFGARPINRQKKATIDSVLADLILDYENSKVERGSQIQLDFVETSIGGKFVARAQNGFEASVEVQIPKTVTSRKQKTAKAAGRAGEAGRRMANPADPRQIVKPKPGRRGSARR